MSVNDLTDEDRVNCESIGKSISDIIRFSFDDEFRKSTFQLFGVSSTKDTENEISKRLMGMIQNENAKKRGKKFSKGKENVQIENDTSEAKETGDSSATNTDCDSQNNSKRTWLQISSEQYMSSAKRKKLNFFSQPQLSQGYEREYEFSNSDAHFSNSQPVPQVSSSWSLCNRATSSSSEPLEDGELFCRKKFKESFKDAYKYLKRNSKSQSEKHLS